MGRSANRLHPATNLAATATTSVQTDSYSTPIAAKSELKEGDEEKKIIVSQSQGSTSAMSSNVNSIVSTAQGIFTNHGSTLLNGLLIVSTIGGQSIIRKLTFACPCSYPLNIIHSAVFILGPSIALFVIGIMVNSTTWKLVHGCCFRIRETRHTWKTVIVSWIEVIIQSSVAPTAWLFVVFLDGGYYRCFLAHNFCRMESAKQCRNETILNYYKESQSFDMMSDNGTYCPACICELDGSDASYLDAESQIVAWFLLIAFGVGTLLVLCLHRMFDKYTLVQRQYVDTYKNIETSKFDQIAKEYAGHLAEQNARAFFTQKDWSKRDWDWVSGVPEINNPMFARLRLIAAEKTQQTMITPLQLWSNHKGYRILQPQVATVVDETHQAGQANGHGNLDEID